MKHIAAPELETTYWFNTDKPMTLDALRGRVVVVEAFQMLCPACVAHALPQCQRVANTFPSEDVAVIGLHTVFEHHEAQGSREALSAFLREYRIQFPVAIDKPSSAGRIPRTMQAYNMQGTPTLLLIDRQGRLRKQHFGREDDLVLGAEIMSLVREAHFDSAFHPDENSAKAGCDETGCPLPEP